MAEPKFKTGDRVRLKGSDQIMVVQRLSGLMGDLATEGYSEPTDVHWVDKQGRPQSGCYEADCLEGVSDPAAL